MKLFSSSAARMAPLRIAAAVGPSGSAAAAPPVPSGDQTVIRKVLAKDSAALNDGKSDAVLPLYADDGIFMPPFSESAIDQTAVRRADYAVSRKQKFNVTFKIAELV